MTESKFAPIHGGLLARKGHAAPATPSPRPGDAYGDAPPPEQGSQNGNRHAGAPEPSLGLTPFAAALRAPQSARTFDDRPANGKAMDSAPAEKARKPRPESEGPHFKAWTRITREQRRQLRSAAAKLDCSQQRILSDALDAYLEALRADDVNQPASLPEREILQELLCGKAIDPVHDAPESIESGGAQSFIGEDDRQFFRDFACFADAVNRIYAVNGAGDGPWRLQDMSDTLIEKLNDPCHGRRWKIFHNAISVGTVEIMASVLPGYSTDDPAVTTFIEMDYARLLAFDKVQGFLTILAGNVCARDEQQYMEAKRAIDQAMLMALWRVGPQSSDSPGIKLRLDGSAKHYLRYRKSRAEKQNAPAENALG